MIFDDYRNTYSGQPITEQEKQVISGLYSDPFIRHNMAVRMINNSILEQRLLRAIDKPYTIRIIGGRQWV